MPEKVIVSRSVYVDPSKVGKRRAADSPSATIDRQQADAVIEDHSTVRYRRRLGPLEPTAPPDDSEPSREHLQSPDPDPVPAYRPPARSYEGDMPALLAFFAIFWPVVFWLVWRMQPTMATLVSAEWRFKGQVQVWKLCTEEDWMLPEDAVNLLTVGMKFYRWNTIVDRYDRVCTDEPRSRTEYSHTTQSCGNEFSHYTPDTEVYSHTEEICYSDGTCDQDDVYVKESGEAVYVWSCHDTPHYREVPYWEQVCRDLPVTHQEAENRLHYTYEIMRWVNNREVFTDSSAELEPADLIADGERFSKEDWTYLLHFSDPKTTSSVSKARYEEYRARIGQVVQVP